MATGEASHWPRGALKIIYQSLPWSPPKHDSLLGSITLTSQLLLTCSLWGFHRNDCARLTLGKPEIIRATVPADREVRERGIMWYFCPWKLVCIDEWLRWNACQAFSSRVVSETQQKRKKKNLFQGELRSRSHSASCWIDNPALLTWHCRLRITPPLQWALGLCSR